MKTILKFLTNICVLIVLLFVTACSDNEVEPVFNQNINDRTNALKTEYRNILTAPVNGWIGSYSPNKNFGAFTMLMKFGSNGSLDIKSDYQNGQQNNVITYRMDKTLKIEVVLESSSVFSKIFEINNNNNQGEFVFNIISATANEVVLESKLDYGSDVTIFKLRPATTADLDLSLITTSVQNIAGNGTQSVFRNILLNDSVIATFDFNPTTRLATVTFIKDGQRVAVSGPINISATGFSFFNPVNVNGTILTSFTFNQTANEYVNTPEKLRIIYDNIPGIPLNPFDLNTLVTGMRYNILELAKTSTAFKNFLETTYRFSGTNPVITRIYLRNLAGTQPFVDIWLPSGRQIRFDVNDELRSDGKVYFTLVTGAGSTNASAAEIALLNPLLDILVRSSAGYYTNRTGGLAVSPSQATFTLINASAPQYAINYYEF